ncbi:formin-like protein 5 [Eumetopias jubatus]|uniref:formin-like protein 5 n=1 Tax=Eumetopias jubatus TaxID=34886 RepID=UPI001015E319|nr:formin-like protein 5 [Eumetopias jubatus]
MQAAGTLAGVGCGGGSGAAGAPEELRNARAALQDEDAEESAAGRALRAVRAAPTKGSSPAARRLVAGGEGGAEGRFPAPRRVGDCSPASAARGRGQGPARPLLPRLRPAQPPPRPPLLPARRHSPAGPCPAPLTRARHPTPRRRRRPRTPLGLRERDGREPQPPPPLSWRSPHALPGSSPPASWPIGGHRAAAVAGQIHGNRPPPSPPKHPGFAAARGGSPEGSRVRAAPPRQVEGLREIKLLARELDGWQVPPWTAMGNQRSGKGTMPPRQPNTRFFFCFVILSR